MCSLLSTTIRHTRQLSILTQKAKVWSLFGKRTTEIGIDLEIVKMLRCPVSKAPLRLDKNRNKLIVDSQALNISYDIENGVLKLLPKLENK